MSRPSGELGTDQNPIYKHKKTGKNYVILMDAVVEVTGQPVIIYKSCDTGQRFIRPSSDFFNGQFELIA